MRKGDLLATLDSGQEVIALAGRSLAVPRLRTGVLRATQAVCPHAGGPLADGQLDDSVVLCPLHAAAFDLETGRARSGQLCLQVYPVRVDREGITVTTGGDVPGAREPI